VALLLRQLARQREGCLPQLGLLRALRDERRRGCTLRLCPRGGPGIISRIVRCAAIADAARRAVRRPEVLVVGVRIESA
jgi:hypothetical protein